MFNNGSQRRQQHNCAVCLQFIEPAETAIVKGCEHTYCATCILTWTAFKQPAPWCPQCKGPVNYLSTFRSLDGELSDFLIEEPSVLLLQATWFKPSERFGALFAKGGSLHGFKGQVNEGGSLYEADEFDYFEEDEFEERSERFERFEQCFSPLQQNGGQRKAAVKKGRGRATTAPSSTASALRASQTPDRPKTSSTIVRGSGGGSAGRVNSAKAKRAAKAQAKLDKETKKATARKEQREQQKQQAAARLAAARAAAAARAEAAAADDAAAAAELIETSTDDPES